MTDKTLPTFKNLAASDRVDHERKTVYASPRPGIPPVPTHKWTDDDSANWDRSCERVRHLAIEVRDAGYRLVTL